MIRHTPAGRGHPYRASLDQRLPVDPEADRPVMVRALASPELTSLAAEVEADGEPALHHGHREEAQQDGEAQTDEGHLAAAAAAGEHADGLVPWAVSIGAFPAGTRVRYRLVDEAHGAATGWWDFTPATWQTARGRLRLPGSENASGRLVAGSESWLVADRGPLRARFALRLDPGEHVIGLGERFQALDQRGWSVDTVVFEQYKQQHARTYLPVPFALVVGGDGWGFHVDTSRRCWFDVGLSDPQHLWVEVTLDPSEPAPEVVLRLWSGEPAEVLDGYLLGVGAPALPPGWVFRPWISGNEWNTEARVRAEVSRSLAEGIPVGVVVIEAWSDEATFTAFRDAEYEPSSDGAAHRLADFSFPDDGAWPDPVGLVKDLHDQGIRVLLWQIPLLPTDVDHPQLAADRDALVSNGYAVREEDGSPYHNRGWWFPNALLPDFTSAEARRWWTAKRRYLVEEVGVDGFKTDGGEHAWGVELRYADGTRGDESNNRYPDLYAGAYHELLASTGREGVTFSRAGFQGAGAHPCHWAGDEDSTWEGYRASITAGLTAAVSGVFFWGWDHGGFSGEIPDAELYLRSAAMACFCPIMQYHSEHNHHRTPCRDRTPWNIAERTGDDRVLPVYRRFATLRERLVPYLTEQAVRAVEGSRPLMRPLCFDWPRDQRLWDYPLQYALGDDLLVAPVTEPGARRWDVYLPAGEWTEAWTGAGHDGERVVTVEAPIDEIPLLIRRRAADDLAPLFADLPA